VTTGPDLASAAGRTVQGWPLGLGLVFAVVIGVVVGGGFATIVFVCGLMYLVAAVIGRPSVAWLAFLLSGPIVALGPVLRAEVLALAIVGALAVVFVIVGVARGTWRIPVNRWQIPVAVLCGAIAVAAYRATSPLVAAGLVAAGLVGHAVWDVLHHRRGVVVSRSYAEFCAAFDIGLAVIVLLSSR
jgi:hypothetical protein